jgi:hypothetical protein
MEVDCSKLSLVVEGLFRKHRTFKYGCQHSTLIKVEQVSRLVRKCVKVEV